MKKFSAMLYLASQSPRRREILRKLGLSFKVVPSAYRETKIRGLGPRALVVRHAQGKALKAKVPAGARFIIGCDTEVFCKGRVLGKPAGFKQAVSMLRLISGKSHAVYSAVALLDRKKGTIKTACEKTVVMVKKLTDAEILEYIKRAHPYDKAGAYGIQAKPKIVKKIKGSYTNVVGLPVETLTRMIKGLHV